MQDEAGQSPVPGPPAALSARIRGLSIGQGLGFALAVAALAAAMALAFERTSSIIVVVLWLLFLTAGLWRLAAVGLGRPPPPPPPCPVDDLPPYAVIAALRHEASMIPQLVGRLARLDYPVERLRGFLVIEADDHATIAAARACARPDWLAVLVAPAGDPMTKPRAPNIALGRIPHGLVTVYDAEDEPGPGQLREAAARFACGPATLACLQAPLRIRPADKTRRRPFLGRQFAAEYAALFEVILPALCRLGLPFPLGGTSNHFRVDVLRRVGGWDPWNVTEDADLGYRLWRQGWRLGVMTTPTWESPPGDLHIWLPQRTRWLKGFMQTWLVHMRRPLGLGWRGLLSLHLTLGVALTSAAFHAAATAIVTSLLIGAALSGFTPAIPPPAQLVLAVGAGSSWLAAWAGARRAGISYDGRDMVLAPFYWSLLSLAFVHAFWRLIRQPFAWDKTPHTPDEAADDHRTGRQAA